MRLWGEATSFSIATRPGSGGSCSCSMPGIRKSLVANRGQHHCLEVQWSDTIVTSGNSIGELRFITPICTNKIDYKSLVNIPIFLFKNPSN